MVSPLSPIEVQALIALMPNHHAIFLGYTHRHSRVWGGYSKLMMRTRYYYLTHPKFVISSRSRMRVLVRPVTRTRHRVLVRQSVTAINSENGSTSNRRH